MRDFDTRTGNRARPAVTVTPRIRLALAALAVTATIGLAACSSTFALHGTHLNEQDIAQVTPGMTQGQVKQALGSPTTVAAVGRGNAFYYISSKTRQTAFFKPQEIDRKVVAVYFSHLGMVERVAHYGMKDGKVFDFISRTTPSVNTNDQSIVQQLFRNLGQRQIFGG
ncbi:MAG: outer membrane protein assembly factor BamE [Hyphomicrobiaceae bacterium]